MCFPCKKEILKRGLLTPHFRCLVLVILLLAGTVVDAAPAERPNIIFFLADDLGHADTGHTGATGFETPNIDRLAAEGLRFTNFRTAASICSPSRAAFLTGGYPQRAGLYMGINSNREAHWFLGLHPDEVTIAEHLKTAGYKTFLVGKWHLGTEPEFLPDQQGFDHYYGMPSNFAHSPRFFDDGNEVFARTPLERLTELYTARVTRIIRENAGEPFFLYYAHNYPHKPYRAGKRFEGTSQDGVRGDVMQELDWGFGEMMRALEEAGIADNTIVIFTSDNGPVSNEYARPFRGTKYVTLEGGHRVPFILHWPARIRQGMVSTLDVNAMDLFPTLSEAAGLPLPADRVYDGENLLPLIEQEALDRSPRDPFFYYNGENLQAVLLNGWKLHLPRKQEQLPFWYYDRPFHDLRHPVLYNLRTDPGEKEDVAKANTGLVQQMLGLAQETRAELGEYMQRGAGQRPTGSIYPAAGVISHPKDWGQVPPEIVAALKAERSKRHPGWNSTAEIAAADTAVPEAYPELFNRSFTYQEAEGLGYEEGITRRDPSDIIRVGDTYFVYYTKVVHAEVPEEMQRLKGSGYVGTVWYATSRDEGRTWTEMGQSLGPGKAGAFDAFATFTPNIVRFDGKYYLYYTGVKPTTPEKFFFENNSTTDQTAIGIAVSESPDGPFRRISDEPVLKPRPRSKDENLPSPFDSFRVDDAALLVRDYDGDGDLDVWLYYKGRNIDHAGRGAGRTHTGLAIADTPHSEHVLANNGDPILSRNHEIMIWPHREGVATYRSMTGTLEYAPDGIDFTTSPLEAPALADPKPAAPGCFRGDLTESVEFATGMKWGLATRNPNAIRDKGKRTPYLVRFELDFAAAETSPKKDFE
jgi:arylsulfatase A-like enzyme